MRKFISKKSLGFIASLMIMTVAFAVPVLAREITATIHKDGNEIGTAVLELDIANEVTFVARPNNEEFTMTLANPQANIIITEGYVLVKVGGVYTGWNQSHWRDVVLSNSNGYANWLMFIRMKEANGSPITGRIKSVNCSELSSFTGKYLDLGRWGGDVPVLATHQEEEYRNKLITETTLNPSIRALEYDADGDSDGNKYYYMNGDQKVFVNNSQIKLSEIPVEIYTADEFPIRTSSSSSSEEKHEEEEAPQPKKSEWRPAPEAAKTPAQTAAAQLTTAQTNLAALSVIPAASKEVFKSSGMPLNMTSVNTVDSNTTKLISANSDIPYNVTFMFLGKPMVCTIPAGFNYAQFTRADGTMNIHDVLWAVYSGNWRKINTRTRTTRGRR